MIQIQDSCKVSFRNENFPDTSTVQFLCVSECSSSYGTTRENFTWSVQRGFSFVEQRESDDCYLRKNCAGREAFFSINLRIN